MRYAAFVSYRHLPADRTWAERLMRRLEGYVVPKALRQAGLPATLGKLFRDADELPTSSDLNGQIKQALSDSDNLIVVCSPDTPKSQWVRREIALFKQMGKGDRIFPVLIAGEPSESYPPELLSRDVEQADGSLRVENIEPLASDVRPEAGAGARASETRAVLRLAAGILGVSYDDLARREEARRRRRQISVAALVATIAVALVGFGFAYQAQRSEAFAQATRVEEAQTRRGIDELARQLESAASPGSVVTNLVAYQGDAIADRLLSSWIPTVTIGTPEDGPSHVRLGAADYFRLGDTLRKYSGTVAMSFVSADGDLLAIEDEDYSIRFYQLPSFRFLSAFRPSSDEASIVDMVQHFGSLRIYDGGQGLAIIDGNESSTHMGEAYQRLFAYNVGTGEVLATTTGMHGSLGQLTPDTTGGGLDCAKVYAGLNVSPTAMPQNCTGQPFRLISGENYNREQLPPDTLLSSVDIPGTWEFRGDAPDDHLLGDPAVPKAMAIARLETAVRPDVNHDVCTDAPEEPAQCELMPIQDQLNVILSYLDDGYGWFAQQDDAVVGWALVPALHNIVEICKVTFDVSLTCRQMDANERDCLTLSPDQRYLASCAFGFFLNEPGFAVLDLVTMEFVPLSTMPAGQGLEIAFTDEAHVVALTDQGHVVAYELPTGELVGRLRLGTDEIDRATIVGHDVIVGGVDGSIVRIDISSGGRIWTAQPFPGSQSSEWVMVPSATSQTILVSDGMSARVIDGETGFPMTPRVGISDLCRAFVGETDPAAAPRPNRVDDQFAVECTEYKGYGFEPRPRSQDGSWKQFAGVLAQLDPVDAGFVDALEAVGIRLESQF